MPRPYPAEFRARAIALVRAGKPQKQAGGEYNLSYSVGGKSVSATIKPSGGDLFDKSIFRRVKAPQNMLK